MFVQHNLGAFLAQHTQCEDTVSRKHPMGVQLVTEYIICEVVNFVHF